jgi:hypothetical protein
MRAIAIATAAAAALAATLAIAGPFDAFKGKMKPGLYDMKMDVDMSATPGIPPQFAKQSHSIQHCVTEQDLEKGALSRGRDGKAPSDCEVKNMNMSGNTATYSMVCPKMTADNKITFNGSGYTMDMKMTSEQNGRPMNMSQHVESKYIGACK